MTGWVFHAMRATSRQWLHRELPLGGVRVSPALSGAYAMTATIEPEYASLLGDDGEPLLAKWGTYIFAEASGQLRGGGIVTGLRAVGSKLTVTVDGFTSYPQGMPLVSTLTWGGAEDGATGAGVDPFTVIRALWSHLQSFPDGDLGVAVSAGQTPYRLGVWHNARRRGVDGELDEDEKAVQEPPIPIDKVWTKKDSKPVAAKGKSVYWKHELAWWDGIEIGQHIANLARQVPFDYRESYAWADSSREDVVMELQLGYPRLGRRQDNLVFVEGENVTDLVAIDQAGTEFANEIRAYGSGEGSKQLRARSAERDGRLRRASLVDRPEMSSEAALKALAGDELRRSNKVTDITGFTVRDHPNARIGSFDVGDDVPVHTRRGWLPTRLWVRITGFDYAPESGDITVRCSRSDRFKYGGV